MARLEAFLAFDPLGAGPGAVALPGLSPTRPKPAEEGSRGGAWEVLVGVGCFEGAFFFERLGRIFLGVLEILGFITSFRFGILHRSGAQKMSQN